MNVHILHDSVNNFKKMRRIWQWRRKWRERSKHSNEHSASLVLT